MSHDISARVIVTGNSDKNWDTMPTLPPTVVLWLCQNSTITNPLVYTLPLGLENLKHGRSGIKSHHKECEGHRIEDRVFVPPMLNTNPIRPITIESTLLRPDTFDTFLDYLAAEKYFALAERYRFVLCLEGNGHENHRLWETLYHGNFPVMLRSPWQESLGYLNLPILSVDSVDDISPNLLRTFHGANSNFSPAETACLWLNYWERMIDEA